IVSEVYTVEIIKSLSEEAKDKLDAANYTNIHFRCADGGEGWKEQAPFDSILVTAAAENIPKALSAQLKTGGRMVIPLGGAGEVQILYVLEKTEDGLEAKPGIAVRFVPMTGQSQIP
ncbi:MAG: protein-L-isoaspartate O-methyltransferase, partial [Victivallaceae bacterium]|nr:protein-L-isoaspartate O-methyltransferase [Victivallaceae bacterium]